MAEPTQLESQKATKYEMPKTFIGEIVLHFADKGSAPEAALVQRVGVEVISLAVFPDGQRNNSLKGGVRHVSDPFNGICQDGWWDYTYHGYVSRKLPLPKGR